MLLEFYLNQIIKKTKTKVVFKNVSQGFIMLLSKKVLIKYILNKKDVLEKRRYLNIIVTLNDLSMDFMNVFFVLAFTKGFIENKNL